MKRYAIPSLALLALTGCTFGASDPVDHDFGEAHRWNIAQQVVNPDPVYEEKDIEGGDGQHAADAVERYRTGEVIEPATIETTDTQSGGPN